MKLFRIFTLILIFVALGSHNLYSKNLANLTGANTNYFYSPLGPEHDEVWKMTEALGVRLLRFPGGWTSNHYDWETGMVTSKDEDDKRMPRVVKVDDFMELAVKKNMKIIYVINIFDPIEKIVSLIKTLDKRRYPVVALEIGNEVYNKRYSPRVGGVDGYYAKAVRIAEAIRNSGSSLRLGIPVAEHCVPGKDYRRPLQAWNEALSKKDLSMFQAVVLHYYLSLKQLDGFDNAYRVALEGIEQCADRLKRQFPDKEVWLTEWNLGMSPKTEYHNTMIHALLMSRIFVGAVMQERISISTYHALASKYFGLFGPDPKHFQYKRVMVRNDEVFRKKPSPLIRSATYFALKMLFNLLGGIDQETTVLKYEKLLEYGSLPVDLITIADNNKKNIVIINPNEKPILLNRIKQGFVSNYDSVEVLAGSRYDDQGSYTSWRKSDGVATVIDVIKPLSLNVFTVFKKAN